MFNKGQLLLYYYYYNLLLCHKMQQITKLLATWISLSLVKNDYTWLYYVCPSHLQSCTLIILIDVMIIILLLIVFVRCCTCFHACTLYVQWKKVVFERNYVIMFCFFLHVALNFKQHHCNNNYYLFWSSGIYYAWPQFHLLSSYSHI